MNQNSQKSRKVVGYFAFAFSLIIALLFFNTTDYSFSTNWWQYCMIILSVLGFVFIGFISNINETARGKFAIIFLPISFLYLLAVVVFCISFKTFDILKLLVAVLMLASAIINYRNIKNK